MAEQILTKEQKKVVAEVDKRLTRAGLPTYTQMEEHLFAALTAAMDGVNLGKQLIEQMARYEPAMAELEKSEVSLKDLALEDTEVSDGTDH